MRYLLPLLFLAACLQTAPAPPRPLPAMAAASTFQVSVSVLGEPSHGGTAWIARSGHAETLLVTAGHVCDTEGLPSSFELLSQAGDKTPATLVRTAAAGEPDLCLLRAVGRLGPSLDLSPADPTYGDVVGYVGAPSLVYGEGMAPFYFGHYAGGNLITTPTAGGASGSAILGSRGVVGVLVAVVRGFNGLTFMVPLTDLRAFLADA